MIPMLIGDLGLTESERELFLQRLTLIYNSNLEMAREEARKKVK